MGVWIPKDYAVDRKFPLFVWFSGGPGGDNTRHARRIAGDEGFICVALPYQKGYWWKSPWSFYEHMLRELERVVPNINPRQRACAGYSSGGAAICYRMVAEDSGFRDYFYAFMPGGAGWVMGDFTPLSGRPIFAFIGAQDHTRVGDFREIENAAKEVQADVTYLEYAGGHVMPTKHFPEMRRWLIEKVLLRDLAERRNSMRAAAASRQYGQAFRAAEEIRWVTAEDSADHAEAVAIIARVKPYGEQLASKMDSAPLAEQQRFAREWSGCDFAEPIARKCEEIATDQLNRIVSQNPVSPDFFRTYIKMWQGFPAANDGMIQFEKFAADALEKIRDISPDSAKYHALKQYIATWESAPSTAEARRMREKIASAELETIKAIQARGSMRVKLREFIRTYEGTESERNARELLKQK